MKLAIAILILSATSLSAAPCEDPVHRQFDFWIGEWNVTSPDGKTAGTNRISKIAGGCVLLEEWTGARGMTGKSFNVYEPDRGVWHQTWVDSTGSVLRLDGKFENGAMRLANDSNRITWTPLGGGDVRQVWEQSGDGGKTWKKTLYTDENTGAIDLVIDPKNPNNVYAAMWHHQRKPNQVVSGGPGSGLYKSVDGGETWAFVAEGRSMVRWS